jgi:hypothetical protein
MEVRNMSNARINLFWLVIFTLTLPLAVVFSTHLARRSFEKVQIRDQVVSVKGYAELPIVSDRAEWSARIVERHADRTQAYVTMSQQRDRVLGYLQSRGFTQEQVSLGPVHINEVHVQTDKGVETNAIEFYEVSQSYSIASSNVEAVSLAARDSGELIALGLSLQSYSPTYLYTKLDDMKLTMLSEATANARDRAERMIAGSGGRLGTVRSASQGVFQITPAFSTEVSGYGQNDTSSINKVIKAVVTVEYAIEG